MNTSMSSYISQARRYYVIELTMEKFNALLASIVSLLVCLEIVAAHIYYHKECQNYKINVAKTCTCSKNSHCLPWCNCHDGFCRCGAHGTNVFTRTGRIIKCRNSTFSSSSSLQKCHCLTLDNSSGKVYVGRCIHACGNFLPEEPLNEFYRPLPCNLTNISSYLCGRFNRNGLNCGYCKDGYSPYLLSYNLSCVKCQNAHKNWWKFIFLGFGPLTCFYVLVLVFHINITSSRMQMVVLFSQIITVPANCKFVYLYFAEYHWVFLLLRIIGAFHTFWNLDFFLTLFNGVCLNVGPLTAYALDYAVALYPLVLILITIKLYDYNFMILRYLCKPISCLASIVHSKSDIRTSIIDSFSTFFLLSFVKILTISFELLIFTEVVELGSGNITRVLFNVPSVEYFSKKHLPYGMIAVVLLFIFTLTPTLLLMIYPCKCFQQFLSFFRINWHFLHAFIDSFQGFLKDGTEQGTYDLRWMSAYSLFIRLSLLVLYAITHSAMYYAFAAIVLVCPIIILINIDPYKNSMAHLTRNNAGFLILLALVYVSVMSSEINTNSSYHNIGFIVRGIIVISATMFSVLYVVVLACYWIIYQRSNRS